MKSFAAAKAFLFLLKTDAEAAVRKCSSNYVFLKNMHRKTLVLESLFKKVHAFRCFLVNIAKLLRVAFL